MIATKPDKLDNGIKDEWLAAVAGSIYDRLTGNEPDGSEDPGMLAAVLILHSMDMQSAETAVPVKVDELARTIFLEHSRVWGQDVPEAIETYANPAVRLAWETIVRWTMFSLQCEGEPEARVFAEKLIKRALETADVGSNNAREAAATPGPAADFEAETSRESASGG